MNKLIVDVANEKIFLMLIKDKNIYNVIACGVEFSPEVRFHKF